MSNVRSLRMSDRRILIGEYAVDQAAEQEAEQLLASSYPELMIVTTPEGKKQIPLHDLLKIEQNFQTEKDTAEKAGFDRGRQIGHQAGLDEGREEARKVVASLSGLLTDITQQRHQLLSEAKEKILELVLKISERLTFSAAELNPDITRSIIEGAVDQLLDKSSIKVKVNPNHQAQLEQYIDRFRGNNTAIKEFIIEPDPRVKFGGCFIETPTGDIDARLDSMYDIIKQSLLEGEDAAE